MTYMQNYSTSIANAMEIQWSCTKAVIYNLAIHAADYEITPTFSKFSLTIAALKYIFTDHIVFDTDCI